METIEKHFIIKVLIISAFALFLILSVIMAIVFNTKGAKEVVVPKPIVAKEVEVPIKEEAYDATVERIKTRVEAYEPSRYHDLLFAELKVLKTGNISEEKLTELARPIVAKLLIQVIEDDVKQALTEQVGHYSESDYEEILSQINFDGVIELALLYEVKYVMEHGGE